MCTKHHLVFFPALSTEKEACKTTFIPASLWPGPLQCLMQDPIKGRCHQKRTAGPILQPAGWESTHRGRALPRLPPKLGALLPSSQEALFSFLYVFFFSGKEPYSQAREAVTVPQQWDGLPQNEKLLWQLLVISPPSCHGLFSSPLPAGQKAAAWELLGDAASSADSHRRLEGHFGLALLALTNWIPAYLWSYTACSICHGVTGTGPGARSVLVFQGGLFHELQGLTCCILNPEALQGWGAASSNPEQLHVQTFSGPVLEINHRHEGKSSPIHL